MMRHLLLIAVLVCWAGLARAADTPTATPVPNTPTPTPTFGPTAIEGHTILPLSFIHWTTKAAAGTVIGQEVATTVCILAFEMYSTDGSTEATMTDKNGAVLFATKGTLEMTLGALGPCVLTPVSFTGAVKGSIGWN